jgi:hypothetical protein
MKYAPVICIMSVAVALASAQVPVAGLQAFYPFDSTANDSTGRVLNNGKLYLTNPTPFVIDRTGKGLAANFDGIDDFILIPNKSSFNLPRDSAVISVWHDADACTRVGTGRHAIWDLFELSSTGMRREMTLFLTDKRDSSANLYRLVEAVACVSNNTDTQVLVLPFSLYGAGWHHTAVSWEKPDLRLYVDGLLRGHVSASLTDAKMSTNNRTTYFGTDIATATKCFCGQIDDVRLYNQALSDSEVGLLANEGGTIGITQVPGIHERSPLRIVFHCAGGVHASASFFNPAAVSLLPSSVAIYTVSGRLVEHAACRPENAATAVCDMRTTGAGGSVFVARVLFPNGRTLSAPIIFVQ